MPNRTIMVEKSPLSVKKPLLGPSVQIWEVT
jgi:hypothetical protein